MFRPLLLRAEVSADLLNPGQDLWVTCWWQNAGETPAEAPLRGVLEMDYGHQRVVETDYHQFRVEWDPFPAPHYWEPHNVWATTARWHVPSTWGGTFHLYLGLCDEQHVPVTVYGEQGLPNTHLFLGDVEVGWGLGVPTVTATQQAFTRHFNDPLPAVEKGVVDRTIRIGDELRAELLSGAPALVSIGSGEATFPAPGWLPEVVLRERATDGLVYSFTPRAAIHYTRAVTSPAAVRYRGSMLVDDRPAAGFTLAFTVKEQQLTIRLEEIADEPGFELLEVRLPALATVAGNGAHLVDLFAGGRLVPVDGAHAIAYRHPYDVRNAGALFDDHGTLVVEAPGLDDALYAAVIEGARRRAGVLGVALTAKVRGYGAVDSPAVVNPPMLTLEVLDARYGRPAGRARRVSCARNCSPTRTVRATSGRSSTNSWSVMARGRSRRNWARRPPHRHARWRRLSPSQRR